MPTKEMSDEMSKLKVARWSRQGLRIIDDKLHDWLKKI